MTCRFCNTTPGHAALCPVPFVAVPDAGVATSDWAAAALAAIASAPDDASKRTVMTDAFQALHRFANNEGGLLVLNLVGAAIDVPSIVTAAAPTEDTQDAVTTAVHAAIASAIQATQAQAPFAAPTA